jgi:hypothetical protein
MPLAKKNMNFFYRPTLLSLPQKIWYVLHGDAKVFLSVEKFFLLLTPKYTCAVMD